MAGAQQLGGEHTYAGMHSGHDRYWTECTCRWTSPPVVDSSAAHDAWAAHADEQGGPGPSGRNHGPVDVRELGRLLYKKRRRSGCSLIDAADEAGVRRLVIRDVETGAIPDDVNLHKIAGWLGMDRSRFTNR